MKQKQIHFYPYCEGVRYNNYYDTQWALRRNEDFIDTNQMSFLSTMLFSAGYQIYIHEDEWFMYEIKLGNNKPFTDREICMYHNLFKLWRAGEFCHV